MTDPVFPPDTFVQQWLARLEAAQPAQVAERVTALEAQQTTSTVALAALTQKLYDMETRMSATDDQIALLGAALTNITADVAGLKDQLLAVQAELALVDPALAAKLQPLVDQAEALAAATPDVPPVEPPVV